MIVRSDASNSRGRPLSCSASLAPSTLDLKDLKIERKPSKARRRSNPWPMRLIIVAVLGAVAAPVRRDGQAPVAPSPAFDRGTLEAQAIRYVARVECTRAGLCTALERWAQKQLDGVKRSPASTSADADSSADADLIRIVADRMVELGYVNDQRFASNQIARARQEGRSLAFIRERLRSRGVDETTIEQTLRDDDQSGSDAEAQAAWNLARKRRLGPFRRSNTERQAKRSRDLAALGRAGFDVYLAEQIVDAERVGDDGRPVEFEPDEGARYVALDDAGLPE